MRLDIRPIPAPTLTNLTATSGLGSIALTWTIPPDSGYRATEVWRSTTNNVATATKIAEVTANRYTALGVSAVDTYYYWVRAINVFGRADGAWSNSATVVSALVTELNLAAGAVTAAKLNVPAINASGNLATGAVSELSIAANAVSAAKLNVAGINSATGKVVASQIEAGTLAAGVVYAGSIAADKITSGTLASNVIYSGTINANQINAGTLAAGVIYGGTISAANITSGTLASGVIYSGEINANKITSGTFTGQTFQTQSTGDGIKIYGINDPDANKRNTLEWLSGGSVRASIGGPNGGIYVNTNSFMPTIYAVFDGYGSALCAVYGKATTSTAGGVYGSAYSGDGVNGSSSYGYGGRFSSTYGTYSAYFNKAIEVNGGAKFNGDVTGITSLTTSSKLTVGGLGADITGAITARNGITMTAGTTISGGIFQGAAVSGTTGRFIQSGNDTTLVGEGQAGTHGIRGKNLPNGTSGIVGLNGSYDFYADGTGTNFGPFTGAHDALVPNGVTIEPGDIVVDIACKGRRGFSNTIFEVAQSTAPMQKNVVGVLAVDNGPLEDCFEPAVFVEGRQEPTEENGLTHAMSIMSGAYYECVGNYHLVAMNALGEGQINVCGEGGNLEAGDLIVSSSMPGKGMKQADDLIRNYTVAKVREAVTFSSPTEVKTVACIYLCG